MIATCRFCQQIITSSAVLSLPPEIVKQLTPLQKEISGLEAATARHLQQFHPDQLNFILQIQAAVIGALTLLTVNSDSEFLEKEIGEMRTKLIKVFEGPQAVPKTVKQ